MWVSNRCETLTLPGTKKNKIWVIPLTQSDLRRRRDTSRMPQSDMSVCAIAIEMPANEFLSFSFSPQVLEAAPKLWDLRTTEGTLTKGGKRGRHREQNERIGPFKRGSVLSDSAGCMLPPQLDVLFCARERK